ncbi:MAG: aspartate/glutamate racemase family protein, partial [Bacteroidales bacterium]|nr:aspartate/glutamate racemase family protein [Bacteroidales bacterium]
MILTLWVLVAACQGRPAHIPVMEAALYDTSSVYYTDFSTYPQVRDQLPVGIFDSGTGGLTVMEAILGSRLLDSEHYIYLGDQANMPYGNYPAEGKTDFLRELIFKDALFLLGHRAKVLVVACNTATAYGLDDINAYLEESGSGIKAIGVIHAGVNATLNRMTPGEESAVGVLATTGTVASGGYERTFEKLSREKGYSGDLMVVSHGSMGFAEAVDGERDFVDPLATAP